MLLFYRLDASDKNNGHFVTGYLVSLNGRLVTTATGSVSCQVELNQLEANRDYVLTVRWVWHGTQSDFSVYSRFGVGPGTSPLPWRVPRLLLTKHSLWTCLMKLTTSSSFLLPSLSPSFPLQHLC